MTMCMPQACQIESTMIANRAVFGLPSQSGPWTPIRASRALMRPSGWYMNSHGMETTTMEVTTGRK